MMKRVTGRHRLALSLVVVAFPASGHTETLLDALAIAYQSNPTLLSQRAQLEATNESYVQAEAGFRPTVSVQATVNYTKAPFPQTPTAGPFEYNSGAGFFSVNQPVYTGGRVTAQVDAATAQILAGREQLKATEESVFLAVVQAYSDVLRDRESLAIQQSSYQTLSDSTQEIRARYEAGANTVTDRDQAVTQLESSRALVDSAQAELAVSVAEYVNAVGRAPGTLTSPGPLLETPASLDAAFDASEHESPTLLQAEYAEAMARAQVREAKAGQHPTVTVSANYGDQGPVAPFRTRDYFKDVGVTATLTQPVFTGGLLGSQVRQAEAQATAARLQVDVTRRSVVQAVAQAWAQKRAATANLASQAAAVRAAQSTFDGMRVEYRAGLRITLDVLTAQETLRDVQISYAETRRDAYVTDAQLLQAVGRLDAHVQTPQVRTNDARADFDRVRNDGAVPIDVIPKALDSLGQGRSGEKP